MKRILIVKLSSLGDIAHALPAVRVLKARTGATLDWVVQPEYAALIRACPLVERVIEFPRHHFWRDGFAFRRELRREPYDLVVDMQGLMKSAVAARMARAAWRVGPAWAREGAPWLYHARPERLPGPRRHAAAELLDLVDTLAPPPPADAPPEPPLPPLEFAFSPVDLGDRPGPHVVFAPFSRWTTKDWPLENFAALGRRLAEEMGVSIRIVGGPADAAKGNELSMQIGDAARNMCGHTNLPGLCAELQSADLVVGVDSGPLHWADALGTPLVAIYGATDPARTGPWNQPDSVVTCAELSCRPCHSRTCRRGDVACLRTLEVEPVLQAAMARL